MGPKKPKKQHQVQLFQIRLDLVCDPTNPLVKLAELIELDDLDEQFAPLYAEDGRAANATRMMIGLTLLQSLYALSEDEVVGRWLKNPYWRLMFLISLQVRTYQEYQIVVYFSRSWYRRL